MSLCGPPQTLRDVRLPVAVRRKADTNISALLAVPVARAAVDPAAGPLSSQCDRRDGVAR
jgi:hypothetical protein